MVKIINLIKFYNNQFIKRKNTFNFNLKRTIYILIIKLYFLFILFILIFFKFKIKDFSKQLLNKFYDILPKLTLNSNKNISNYNEIFQSRELYINNGNLTNEYIRFLRPINEREENKIYNKTLYKNIDLNNFLYKKRPDQYSFEEFYKLCNEEKFINSNIIQYFNQPLVSVIIPSFNKENEIRKSVLSIQNQSLKNIEIIIVDDCSTDKSKYIYKSLLDIDPRIRIITHIKNLGIWRTRIDGFLYSKGKYVIQFDMEDFYTDNYVLQDAYDLIKKYNLDSIRFSFIRSEKSNNPYNNSVEVKFLKKYTKIMYGTRTFDIRTWKFGTVWNRLTRADILTRGLYLLDSYLLNARKNLWEDRWYNILINKMCFNYILVNRPGYLYLPKKKGERSMKLKNEEEKDLTIREFIYFWLFDLKMLPKENNKESIIRTLNNFNSKNNKYKNKFINLSFLNKKFEIYEHLLNLLINDPFIRKKDKIFVHKLLKDYKNKFQ